MRTTSSGSTSPATVSTMLEGGVERLVAGVEGVGGDVGDGLLGAGDGHRMGW